LLFDKEGNMKDKPQKIFSINVFYFLSGGFSLMVIFLCHQEKVKADASYFALTPAAPFTQNWTNTGLITTNDNWSGVPSIIGYRGDALTTSAGTDPQTILADGASTPLDVNSNQTNPNTFTTGGVAEFEISDPVVALQGSDTADAPFIDIRLDTTGCTSGRVVQVKYNLRDIDGSADNAVQQVALHYRVGNSGNYTNVSSAYVADATTGPNQSALVTPVSVSLPLTVLGESQVHVRIMTTNAAGADEWVGIDDINIACSLVTAAPAAINGRVMSADGRAIAKVWVRLTGGPFLEPRSALTSSFGYYTFENLPTGETYILTVSSKIYTFSAASRVINLQEDVSDADFVAVISP
jgi:hypothetical protein